VKHLVRVTAILALMLTGAVAGAADKHRLILDWFPNADHVPLYVAREAGIFTKHGLDIELIPPADPNDPLKLVAAGQAAFAINYQPNVIIARAAGLNVKSIGALVDHPLSSLAFLQRSKIRTPADLKGKRIGYSVETLELALLKVILEGAGLKMSDVTTINVNFNLTSALLSGQADAVMGAFWNYELAELELEKVPGAYFAMEKYGVPDYSELIVISNDKFLKDNTAVARRLVAAVQEAIDFTRRDPDKALAMYFKANPTVRKDLDQRAFQLTLPQFAHTQDQSKEKWATWARFALDRGLIAKAVDPDSLILNLTR
jgi:putative hydroxymethylpyrimidine transport system substrate-binding protein